MRKAISLWSLTMLMVFALTGEVLPHCDTTDGPVVKAAQKALETGDAYWALIWVREQDEPEIREQLRKTLEVRKLGDAARELADRYFFETLVRLHRTGEGAPYTGLKPAGQDIGPVIPVADRAVETGKSDELVRLLTHDLEKGLHKHFTEVMAHRDYKTADVGAGREFAHAYVEFVHYAERLYAAIAGAVGDRGHSTPEPEAHGDHN